MQRSLHPALLEAIKLFLSALVASALVYPFLLPEPVGLAKELAVLGVYGAVALGTPDSRKAKPNSVWWMLVLPYNFIEDFFIIHAVTESLRHEASINSRLKSLKSLGALTGFGWCAAQIGSLIPNQIGSSFAVLALIMWVFHWRLIRKAKASLRVA
jgi:hypothetical protein